MWEACTASPMVYAGLPHAHSGTNKRILRAQRVEFRLEVGGLCIFPDDFNGAAHCDYDPE